MKKYILLLSFTIFLNSCGNYKYFKTLNKEEKKEVVKDKSKNIGFNIIVLTVWFITIKYINKAVDGCKKCI